MNGLSRPVGQNLHFNVTRTNDSLLDKHPVVTKGCFGLPHGGFEGRAQLIGTFNPAHSPAAAARNRFGEYWETNVVGGGHQSIDIGRGVTGYQHRNAGRDRGLLGLHFVSREFQHI